MFAIRGTARRHCLVAATVLGLPAVALAHGQEVLFLPLGNIVGLAVAAGVALAVRARLRVVAWAMAAGLIACIPPWYVSNDIVPTWVQGSGTWWLLVGALPPATVVVAVLAASMRRIRKIE